MNSTPEFEECTNVVYPIEQRRECEIMAVDRPDYNIQFCVDIGETSARKSTFRTYSCTRCCMDCRPEKVEKCRWFCDLANRIKTTW